MPIIWSSCRRAPAASIIQRTHLYMHSVGQLLNLIDCRRSFAGDDDRTAWCAIAASFNDFTGDDRAYGGASFLSFAIVGSARRKEICNDLTDLNRSDFRT